MGTGLAGWRLAGDCLGFRRCEGFASDARPGIWSFACLFDLHLLVKQVFKNGSNG